MHIILDYTIPPYRTMEEKTHTPPGYTAAEQPTNGGAKTAGKNSRTGNGKTSNKASNDKARTAGQEGSEENTGQGAGVAD
jgi:hypothetical protein